MRSILDQKKSELFLNSFKALITRLTLLGALNSLSQLVLKATIPGVPDFYQGTEFWDLSLVDPDNRRQVNFAARQQALESDRGDWNELAKTWRDGLIKFVLTRRLLQLRRICPTCSCGARIKDLKLSGGTLIGSWPSAGTMAEIASLLLLVVILQE